MDYQQGGGGNRGCYNCEFATMMPLLIHDFVQESKCHCDRTAQLTNFSLQAATLLIRYNMVMC